jgi:cation:H+ antiporter
MDIVISLVVIVVLLVLIVACCSFFTNAIEWTGHRFNLSEGAVGSVLAAVGTALPETLVPIIAIVSGLLGVSHLSLESGHDIGIGAILGAPFLLGTLAMFVTACAVYYFAARDMRDTTLKFSPELFRRDFHYFFPAYITVFLAAFIPNTMVKQGLAIGLVAFYGFYVYRTLNKEHVPDEEFELEGLFFAPKTKEPSTFLIMAQLVASLVALLVMVHFFVEEIQSVSTSMKISAMLLSLIITPIATELPEKFNSVMWIRSKRDNLALGNITGAMVFQSCIPTAIGLAFTPWILTGQGMLSVALCMGSSIMVYFTAWKKPAMLPQVLFYSGGFYLVFLLFALFSPL